MLLLVITTPGVGRLEIPIEENPLHRAAWPGNGLARGWTGVQWLSFQPASWLPLSCPSQTLVTVTPAPGCHDRLSRVVDKVQNRTVIPSQQNHRPPFVRRPITKTKLQQLRPPLPPPAIEHVCIIQQSRAMGRACVRASPSSNARSRPPRLDVKNLILPSSLLVLKQPLFRFPAFHLP